ncbi:MAG: DUF4350 domain-containing protein, partial [Candidatus Eremiobacteraeota bacterium]|nr:DUF4350 domain-containing protein [Candidatus Eremiobacteraeota bacterium]
PSTFDFGRSGYAALYQLLRSEGVHAERFERSHLRLSAVTSALVIAQLPYDILAGGGGVSRNDVVAIKDWVVHGGRLIVLSPPYGDTGDTMLGIPPSRSSGGLGATLATPLANLPKTSGVRGVSGRFAVEFSAGAAPKALPILVTKQGIVAIEYPLGRGDVVAITDPSIFSNERLRDADNARFAFNLFAPTGVYFDEAVHGYTSGTSLWAALPAPARYAVYIAAAVLLFAFIGNLIRFAPPFELPQAGEPDSSAYLTAMASLLERAGAARRVLRDRADFTLRAVRRALGLSDRTEIDALLQHIERTPVRSDIAELNRLSKIERPSAAELIRAGTLSAKLQKEFGI